MASSRQRCEHVSSTSPRARRSTWFQIPEAQKPGSILVDAYVRTASGMHTGLCSGHRYVCTCLATCQHDRSEPGRASWTGCVLRALLIDATDQTRRHAHAWEFASHRRRPAQKRPAPKGGWLGLGEEEISRALLALAPAAGRPVCSTDRHSRARTYVETRDRPPGQERPLSSDSNHHHLHQSCRVLQTRKAG